MNAPRRAPRRVLDGVLLLDKPIGLTSNAALQKARWLYNAAKAGHTGTLDPLATGLLPLCFGEATKFAGELLDADKAYDALIRLGVTTRTADAEGEVLEVRPVAVTPEQVRHVLQGFVGEIMQVPPMHSALKRDGKALYEYARAGIEVEREPRRVTVYGIRFDRLEGDLLAIAVDCSKGTYIRTLAEDIGAALGCGAHLAALRRTRIGQLMLTEAVTLVQIESVVAEARDTLLAPVDALLAGVPRFEVAAVQAARLLQGQTVGGNALNALPVPVGRLRLYGMEGEFLGLGMGCEDGTIVPKRMRANVSMRLPYA
jgi:tRNA pseudouridine55 synthase